MLKNLYKSLVNIIDKIEHAINHKTYEIKKEIQYNQRLDEYNQRLDEYNMNLCYTLFDLNDLKKSKGYLYKIYELKFDRYREVKGKEKLRLELEEDSFFIDFLNIKLNFKNKNA